jgi:surfeit locus 1 family protein
MIELGKRRFRPHLWPTLMTLFGLAVLLALGTWQVQRLHWKQALIAKLEARAGEAPMSLPAAIVDPEALEFRPLRLDGRFRHEREMYLVARTHEGRVGLHVVTPFVLDGGRTILVDRGWVPPARKAPESRAAGQLEGPLTVLSTFRRGGWSGYRFLRPENQPDENAWLWMDLPAMAAYAGLPRTVTELYAVAGPAAVPGGYPIGMGAEVKLRDAHLQYAITWYALAFALLTIYLLHQSLPEDTPSDDECL